MATDISSVNGSIWSLTKTGKKTVRYSKAHVTKYFFTNASSSALTIEFSAEANETPVDILLTDLRVAGSGSAPVSESAALTALDTVFLKAAAPASTTAVTEQATKAIANAAPRTAGYFIRVSADETNNGDKVMYYDNGTTLEFQYLIP